MSVITWPGFSSTVFSWTLQENQVPFKSVFGTQALEVAAPVWSVQITGSAMTWANARALNIFIESLRGYRNQIALWNLTQPLPLGTMRGIWTLSADAGQGDTTLQIDGGVGQAGKTLLAGDLIGFGVGDTQQVARITQDAVADVAGVIEVNLGVPLRNSFAAGAGVEWNRPKALFRQSEIGQPIQYIQSIIEPWSIQLLENWKP